MVKEKLEFVNGSKKPSRHQFQFNSWKLMRAKSRDKKFYLLASDFGS